MSWTAPMSASAPRATRWWSPPPSSQEPSYAPVNEERYDHTLWPRQHDDVMRADVTFFEAPKGGAVLSFGSMNYIGALPVDGYTNAAARLVLNAIRRFGDPAPFPGYS